MKVIKTAALVVGAVALVATGVGAVVGGAAFLAATGVSLATVTAIGTVAGLVSTAANAISPPKAAKGTIGGSQTDFKLDPNAGIPYVIGRTYAGGNIVHRETWGTDNQYQGFAVSYSGAGPVQGLEAFLVDQGQVTFDGAGNAQGTNAGWLYGRFQLGACPSPAIGSPVAGFPGVSDASFKLSGYAAATLVFKFDVKAGKKWSTGIPKTGGVWNGVKVYDPRQDSTYPGGAGACRALDETTYVGGAAAENPWLHALTFALGRFQNGRRVLGVGQKPASINMATFVDAANVADANGWKCGGVVYSIDDKWDVLRQLAQAGGGQCVRLGAQLSAYVNSPKVALATVQEADLVAKGSVSAALTYRDRLNGLVPKFRSEADGWEMVPGAVVRVQAYVDQDGEEKTAEWPLPLVQQRTQAGQLAAYELVNRREFGPITLPLFIRFLGYKPGDALNLNVGTLGLVNQLAVVRKRALNPEGGDVQLQLVSETSTKHAYALGQSPVAPPAPSLGVPDEAVVAAPAAGAWVAAGGGLANGDAVTPVVVVYGNINSPIAEAFLVEYKLQGSAEWLSAGSYPAKTTRVQITSVAPGSTYDVAVSNIRRGIIGERRQLAAVTTSSSVAGSSADLGDVGKLDEIYFGSPTLKESAGGVAATLANFKTASGTAAAIAGQGAFATQNSAAYGSPYLTGFGALAPLGNVAFGSPYLLESSGGAQAALAAFKTALGIASGISGQGSFATLSSAAYGSTYLTGFGALAARARVSLGDGYVFRSDGTTSLTDALAVTALGTAAALAGQGAFATLSSAAYGSSLLTGFGSLAPLASVYFGSSYVLESNGGAQATLANFKTASGTAAAIAGQGAYATVSTVSYGSSFLSGFGGLAGKTYAKIGAATSDGGSLLTSNGFNTTDAQLITASGTAAAISGQGAFATVSTVSYGSAYLAGFGLLAANNYVRMDGPSGSQYAGVYNGSGTGFITEGGYQTALGTAAALAGQGYFATQNYADFLTRVTGTGKPEAFATSGINLVYNGNAEQGSTGWIKVEETYQPTYFSAIADSAASGVNCFQLSKYGPVAGGGYGNVPFTVTPGERLVVMCDYLGATSSGNAAYLCVNFKNSPTTNAAILVSEADSRIFVMQDAGFGLAYRHVEGIITVPAGARYASVEVIDWQFGPTDSRWDNIACYRVMSANSKFGVDGRVTDPTAYNTQALLGPSSTTTLSPTYTVGGSNVTVNLPAHSRVIAGPSGPLTLNYGAGSGVVAFNAYWVAYIDDPNLAGVASPTIGFSSDPNVLLYPGRYQVSSGIAPAAGGAGGSTGGGGGGGGRFENCVCALSYMPGGGLAGGVLPGDQLRVLDEDSWDSATSTPCRANSIAMADCVRLVTSSGIALVLSASTPCTMRGGECVAAAAALGAVLAVQDQDGFRWEPVVQVDQLGARPVAHISADGGTYAAGEVEGRYLFSHNIAYKP